MPWMFVCPTAGALEVLQDLELKALQNIWAQDLGIMSGGKLSIPIHNFELCNNRLVEIENSGLSIDCNTTID